MLPIPTHIRVASFKSLSEAFKGKKLFKLGSYVFVQFIGAQCLQSAATNIKINVVDAFCLFTRNTPRDPKPTEFIRGFLLQAVVEIM